MIIHQTAISVLQMISCPVRECVDFFTISQEVLLESSRMTGDLKHRDGHVASL